jgi:hypothetical protein
VRQFANPLEKATLESDEYEKCYVERMFVMTGRRQSWRKAPTEQQLMQAAGAHRSGTIAIRSGARQAADRLKIGRAVRA